MTNNISANQAAKWLAEGKAILIDVRNPDEFKEEHIAYATSLPLGEITGLFAQLNIPQDRKIIFQCLKGTRGGQACTIIQSNTECCNEIHNIEGGISAWKEAGLPVIGQAPTGLSIMRQVQVIVGGLIALFVMLGFMGITLAFMIAGIFGLALLFAGLTGWCGLAMLLSKMPWNKK